MRKWVVIGVLLIGVASVLGFLLTRPKEGSVEWHKREYRKAFDRLQGKNWAEQGRRLLQRVIGAQPSRLAGQQRDWYMKLEEHRSALLETGYFVQRTFVITNADGRKISKTIALGWRELIPKENIRYTWMEKVRADVLTIVGRPEDMPKWEEAVRKLDVPDPNPK